MGVITLLFSSRQLSRRFLVLGPMSALSAGDTRCSTLERPGMRQNVRTPQKISFPLDVGGRRLTPVAVAICLSMRAMACCAIA